MEDEKFNFYANNIFTKMTKNVKRPKKEIEKIKQNISEISKNIVLLQRQSLIPRKIKIKKHLIKKRPNNQNTPPNQLNLVNNNRTELKLLLTDSNENNNNNNKPNKRQFFKHLVAVNKKILNKNDNKSQIFLTNLYTNNFKNSLETKTLKTSKTKCNLPFIPKRKMKREISEISSKISNKESSTNLKLTKLKINFKDNISKSIENFENKNEELKSEIRNRQDMQNFYNEIFCDKINNSQKKYFKKSDTNIDIFNDLNELSKKDSRNKFIFSNTTEDLVNDLKYNIRNKNYITESNCNKETIVNNAIFLKYKSKVLTKTLKQIDQRRHKEKEKDKQIEDILIQNKRCLNNIRKLFNND